jgi:hypothetical protein
MAMKDGWNMLELPTHFNYGSKFERDSYNYNDIILFVLEIRKQGLEATKKNFVQFILFKNYNIRLYIHHFI